MSKFFRSIKSGLERARQKRSTSDRAVLRHGASSKPVPTDPLSLGRSLKVLLVEDNPVVQVVTLGVLKSMGCEAELAQNGRLALHMTLETQYDLVLMDCKLPDIDGYAATTTIKGRKGSLELVMGFTSHNSQEEIDRCKKSGMLDVITKPATVEDFERILGLVSKLITTRDRARSLQ